MKLSSLARMTALVLCACSILAADKVELRMEPKGVLEVHGNVTLPFSSSRAIYKIERSSNLTDWTSLETMYGAAGLGDEILRKAVSTQGEQGYYRVIKLVDPGEPMKNDGAAVFGYADAFSKELQK